MINANDMPNNRNKYVIEFNLPRILINRRKKKLKRNVCKESETFFVCAEEIKQNCATYSFDAISEM